MTKKATRMQRRLCMTYVSMICDDDALQRLLPQYLLANCHTVRKKDMLQLTNVFPPNIRFLRRKTAWVDSAFCLQIVRDLREFLSLRGCHRTVILYWDCARPHIVPAVITKARALNIQCVMIPPRTTGILQPLDTHAFYKFKKCLQGLVHDVDVEGEGTSLEIACFLKCVVRAISEIILKESWQHSFAANGLSGSQGHVCQRIRDSLGHGVEIDVGHERPSLASMARCFPRGFVLTEHVAYGTPREAQVSSCKRKPNARREPDARLGRTRSETVRMKMQGCT